VPEVRRLQSLLCSTMSPVPAVPTVPDLPAPSTSSCVFCSIAARELDAAIVAETDHTIAFLDHSPVFAGHVLLTPKIHIETLETLPAELIAPLFSESQRLARAVRHALDADGTWVSMNNTVSQSVPHLHVHVIPRKRKDGLRGFYWPRVKYANTEAMFEVALRIATALETS
jgi:histidine triad (HIT) family protein